MRREIGNQGLCGVPLASCDGTIRQSIPSPSPSPTLKPQSQPSPSPSLNSNASNSPPEPPTEGKPPTLTIVIVSIVAAVALAAILVALFILRGKKQEEPDTIEAPPPSNLQNIPGIKDAEQRSIHSQELSVSGDKKPEQTTKLSFVRDDREKFDLQDLLRSSAEVLGSGCFGSSYKAALGSGKMMVVKRFKKMNNVGREDFSEHMRRLGRLRHDNLLPLVAYYYRKEEKLLVSDFVQRGSLAVHLHGKCIYNAYFIFD